MKKVTLKHAVNADQVHSFEVAADIYELDQKNEERQRWIYPKGFGDLVKAYREKSAQPAQKTKDAAIEDGNNSDSKRKAGKKAKPS